MFLTNVIHLLEIIRVTIEIGELKMIWTVVSGYSESLTSNHGLMGLSMSVC